MGIQIELNGSDGVFTPGDVVEGRVLIHKTKSKKVKAVTVSLQGRGKVNWKEKVQYQEYTAPAPGTVNVPVTKTKTVTYSAEEDYVSQTIWLIGDGDNNTNLPVGTTSYPFKFPLPNNIPSTFTSEIGQIEYVLKGEIRRSLFQMNDKVRYPITVISPIDLNHEKGAEMPQQQCRTTKEPSIFTLRKGKLSLVLSLPERSGFVPGDILNFQAYIMNDSNQKVKGVKASLQRVGIFTAKGNVKTVIETVCEVDGPEVRPGGRETWTPSNLSIPQMIPPTKLGGWSQIIDVQYILYVRLKMSGWMSSPFSAQLPIIIGTIPLRRNEDKYYLDRQSTSASCPQYETPPATQYVPTIGLNLNSNIHPSHPPPPGIAFLQPQYFLLPSMATPIPTPMPSPYSQQINFGQAESYAMPSAPEFQPPYPPPSYGELPVHDEQFREMGNNNETEKPSYSYKEPI